MEQQIIQSSIEVLLPVLESTMMIAGEYSKKCGRTIVTGMDFKYAMRYCARNKVGERIGSHFPDIYEQDTDSDDSDIETVEETEDDFTRYQGDDALMNAVNEAYDTWDSWEPTVPAERMLKDAVDKNN